jgi:hypothetical protein
MRTGFVISLRFLSVAWVCQAAAWSFPWLAKATPSGLWSILAAGEFRGVVTAHVLLAACSAAAPVLLWLRRETIAASVLVVAAASFLWLLATAFSPEVLTWPSWLWLYLPRAALSLLTLGVVFLHAVVKALVPEGSPMDSDVHADHLAADIRATAEKTSVTMGFRR